jgi:hypothetical protein
VVEFIEHYYVRLMQQVITRVYGEGVTLQYRLQAPQADVSAITHQPSPVTQTNHLTIANAKGRFQLNPRG